MTEAQLLAVVRDACRWSGVLTYHTADSRCSERGYPDLVCVGTTGVLYRELKTERGRLTPDQRVWLDRLTLVGVDASVWRPADWPSRILAELSGIGGRRLLYDDRPAAS